MITNKQYEQAVEKAAVDALTTGTGVVSQGVIAGAHTGIDHAYDAYSYTMNNTANQTLNTVQITNSAMKNHNIVFHGPSGQEIGRFDFNGDEVKFTGQADTSAAVFIEWARRTFADRALEDKRSVLKEVMDALVHESTGALYEDAEKLAILTCIQRVQEIQRSVEPPQEQTYYGGNNVNAVKATRQIAPQKINPFGGQP